jgi:predicted aspartyl protease
MRSLLFAAGIALCTLTVPTQAQECNKPLKIVASVPLTSNGEHRRLEVPVEIGGKQKKLILDTGADVSVISSKAAQELGLKVRNAPVRVYSITGSYSESMAEAPLKLGLVQFDKVQFMVTDDLDKLGDPDAIGLLGANVLSLFDVSIDMAAGKLDLISHDHCLDQVIYWPATTFAKIPFQRQPGMQIIVGVTLDGKPVKAVVDTGASNSTLRTKTAESQYGIVLGSENAPASGSLNGDKNLVVYRHTFKALNFEGVTVANPTLDLIPDKLTEPLSYTPTGSRIGYADDVLKSEVLLGMDVLRHMHIYIAYHDRILYLTPAEAPRVAK